MNEPLVLEDSISRQHSRDSTLEKRNSLELNVTYERNNPIGLKRDISLRFDILHFWLMFL